VTHGDLASADHAELHALAVRYANAVDRRDAELFLSVFTPDAALLIFDPSDSEQPTGERRGREQLAKVPELIKRYSSTYHLVGNATYEVVGDKARGEVYCIAHHLSRRDEGDSDYVMFIRYVDAYRRLPGERWLIAERRLLVDWTETRPVNPSATPPH
jgi:hypothetical protein